MLSVRLIEPHIRLIKYISEVMHKNIYFSEVNDVTYDHEYKPKTNYPYNFYSIAHLLNAYWRTRKVSNWRNRFKADTETLLSKFLMSNHFSI